MTNDIQIATLTQSQCEFIGNEPADLLRREAIYVLHPQLPVPKIMHINGKEITSYRFTAIEVINGKYSRCVKIKATSLMRRGEINGVPFNNQNIIQMNLRNPKSNLCKIVSSIAILYLGQGKYYDNWYEKEMYCEAFEIYPDKEGYCQNFSLVDLCPQIHEYLL